MTELKRNLHDHGGDAAEVTCIIDLLSDLYMISLSCWGNFNIFSSMEQVQS